MAIAAAPLFGQVHSERELVVRFDQPQGVKRITVTWLDAGEVLWTSTHHFQSAAPKQITRTLRLAEGRYAVLIDIERNGRSEETKRMVEVADDAARIVLPIR